MISNTAKNNLFFICAFGLLVSVLFCSFAYADEKKAKFTEAQKVVVDQEKQAIDDQKWMTIDIPKKEYTSEKFKDPFQPVLEKRENSSQFSSGSGEAKLPTLVVQGLVWGAQFPQAIINNKVVKEGQEIEGARIIKIDKEGVVLVFEGRQYNLNSPAITSFPVLQKKDEKKSEGGQNVEPS